MENLQTITNQMTPSHKVVILAPVRKALNSDISKKKLDRTSAHSKVNFSFLSKEERQERYHNTLVLRDSLRQNYIQLVTKRSKKQIVAKEPKTRKQEELLQAKSRLASAIEDFEFEDCATLLEDLAESLATASLKTDSLELALIGTLLHKAKTLPREGSLPLSERVKVFFNGMSREKFLQFLTGLPTCSEKPAAASVPRQAPSYPVNLVTQQTLPSFSMIHKPEPVYTPALTTIVPPPSEQYLNAQTLQKFDKANPCSAITRADFYPAPS